MGRTCLSRITKVRQQLDHVDFDGSLFRRLLVDDSVRSYAAFYEPPAGSSVGQIFHLHWCGFISPPFVHSILQEVLVKYVFY